MSSTHRVMIVEDDEDVRELLAELIEAQGFSTVRSANGKEALEELGARRAGNLPCVILLDVRMPVMDGPEFRAAQRCDPLFAQIPVIVMSAHADAITIAEPLRGDVSLPKPLDLPRLFRLLREHCARPIAIEPIAR